MDHKGAVVRLDDEDHLHIRARQCLAPDFELVPIYPLRIGANRAIRDMFDVIYVKTMLIDLRYVPRDPFEVMHRLSVYTQMGCPVTRPRRLRHIALDLPGNSR